MLLGKRVPRPATLARLHGALASLEADARQTTEHEGEVLGRAEEACQRSGLRQTAEWAGVDAANLAHVLSGRRKPSGLVLEKLRSSLS